MVARNVVVITLRTTNPFRSRFDSGHRQIGEFGWFDSSVEGYFFYFLFSDYLQCELRISFLLVGITDAGYERDLNT